ncbi:MAG TPA: FixH family protein [Ramlibacter sp.]
MISTGTAGSSMRSDAGPSSPWWTHGHVWLVISGPAAVVVAALLTAWIAVAGQDPVIDEDYYRRGTEINKQLAKERALNPAEQARNHAATPVRP